MPIHSMVPILHDPAVAFTPAGFHKGHSSVLTPTPTPKHRCRDSREPSYYQTCGFFRYHPSSLHGSFSSFNVWPSKWHNGSNRSADESASGLRRAAQRYGAPNPSDPPACRYMFRLLADLEQIQQSYPKSPRIIQLCHRLLL